MENQSHREKERQRKKKVKEPECREEKYTLRKAERLSQERTEGEVKTGRKFFQRR